LKKPIGELAIIVAFFIGLLLFSLIRDGVRWSAAMLEVMLFEIHLVNNTGTAALIVAVLESGLGVLTLAFALKALRKYKDVIIDDLGKQELSRYALSAFIYSLVVALSLIFAAVFFRHIVYLMVSWI